MSKTIKQIKEELITWIQDYFEKNGKDCSAVIGISGGKDSSVCATLLVEALGKDRVLGVLMPNGNQHDIQYSKDLVEYLGIQSLEVNIQPYAEHFEVVMREKLKEVDLEFSEQAKVNYPARLRMVTLYSVAQSLENGGRVCNTCNLSEDYVGYATKFGDGAGDFSLLSNLTVRKVKLLGKELELSDKFIDKTPEDGLSGKTDEDNLGMTYDQIDDFIELGTSGDTELDKIILDKKIKNQHKLEFMPMYNPVS